MPPNALESKLTCRPCYKLHNSLFMEAYVPESKGDHSRSFRTQNRSHGPESWETCSLPYSVLLSRCDANFSLYSQSLEKLEQELDTKIYPGTEIMRDVETHHFMKSQGQSVLVPQPSDDEHDPLVRMRPIRTSGLIRMVTAK
jgi:hypothetical protein